MTMGVHGGRRFDGMRFLTGDPPSAVETLERGAGLLRGHAEGLARLMRAVAPVGPADGQCVNLSRVREAFDELAAKVGLLAEILDEMDPAIADLEES
jgi:hypothetical protein